MDKFKSFIALHKEIFAYLLFGVLTTVVNYTIYFIVFNILSVSATISNIISWIFAVAFAFVTNKVFVFSSKDWALKNILTEISGFLGCRIGSGVLETLIIYIATDFKGLDGNITKIVTGILVVILNYFGSKRIAFRGRKKGG